MEEGKKGSSLSFKDSSASSPFNSAFSLVNTLNSLSFANKVKLGEIDKIRAEIESLKKTQTDSRKYEMKHQQVVETERALDSLQNSNKQYEHLVARTAKEKNDAKKRLQDLQETHKRFTENYEKIMKSKELAYLNFSFAKHSLLGYEKETNTLNTQFEKELENKAKIKEMYSSKSRKIQKKLDAFSIEKALLQQNQNFCFKNRQKKIEEIEKQFEKINQAKITQKNIQKTIHELTQVLKSKKVSIDFPLLDSISQLLSLYKDQEYLTADLSAKFNDLSSSVLLKKTECEELKKQLWSVKASLPDRAKQTSSSPEAYSESLLSAFYAKFKSFSTCIYRKLKKVEENCPTIAPLIEDILELSPVVQVKQDKKRSFFITPSRRVKPKSKTIREASLTYNLLETLTEKENNLAGLFKEHGSIPPKDLRNFLKNQIVLLCLKPVDVGDWKTGNQDLLKLYQVAHLNMRSVVQKIVKKISGALLVAKKEAPEGVFVSEIKVTGEKFKPTRSVKFKIEQKEFEWSDRAVGRTERNSKFLSEGSTPVGSVGSWDVGKEIRRIGKKVREIELNEMKACVSNKIILSEKKKWKNGLPSLKKGRPSL